MRRTAASRGFTLLELTSVIAIVGVLAAILLPALARSREAARRVSCMGNLVNISIAFHAYAAENGGELPWSGGKNNARALLKLASNYAPDPRVFICPSDSDGNQGWGDDDAGPLTARLNQGHSLRQSYEYLGAYTTTPIKLPPPARGIPHVPLLWDLSGNHIPGGANVLYLDGNIEFQLRGDFFAPYLPVNPPDYAFEMPGPPPSIDETPPARKVAPSSNPTAPKLLKQKSTPPSAPSQR